MLLWLLLTFLFGLALGICVAMCVAIVVFSCCFCGGHCCVMIVLAFVCIVVDFDLLTFVSVVTVIAFVPFHLYVGGSASVWFVYGGRFCSIVILVLT